MIKQLGKTIMMPMPNRAYKYTTHNRISSTISSISTFSFIWGFLTAQISLVVVKI